MKTINESINRVVYCRLFKNFWLALLLILITFVNVTRTTAQNEPPGDSKRGIASGASYSVSDIENINLTNGNLMMNIPLVNLPKGRGSVGQSLGLVYNSKLLKTGVDELQDITGQMSLQRRLLPDNDGGWHYTPRGVYSLNVESKLNTSPMTPCNSGPYEWGKNAYTFKVEMTFPDGSTKMFRPAGYTDYYADDYYNITANGYQYTASATTVGQLPDGSPSWSCSLTDSLVTTDPMVYYSTDGSYLKLVVEHSSNSQDKRGQFNPWTLYFPDGGKITGGTNVATKIYDRNGNYVEGLADNVGRVISVALGTNQNEDLVKVKGFNNEELQYVVRWKNIYVQREYETEAVTDGIERGNPSEQVYQGEYRVIDEIVLPPQMGSLMYQFEYHASDTPLEPGQFSTGWGELKSITLPSGAQANYEYVYQSNLIFQNQPRLKNVLRFFVAKKTLSYNTEYDGTTTPVSEIWNYNVGLESSTMTAPDGSVTTQKHGNVSYENRDNGLVFEIENSNGTKVEKAWEFNETPWTQGGNKQINPYVKAEFTSIKDSTGNYTQTAVKEFNYDKNGNQTEVREYDFVPYANIVRGTNGRPIGSGGGLARITQTAYNNPTPDALDSSTNAPNAYWNAGSPNIRNSVAAMEVKDGSGNVVSRSEMTYDNPSTTGNLTEAKTWDSSKGAYSNPLTSANSVSVANQYDSYGNLTQTTDARGIVSKLTYGSISTPNGTVTDLYPTESVAAFGTAEARTMQTEYDFSTGAVKKVTDADNNVSTETEYDALARPVKVKAAAGTANEVWTQTVYDDVARRVISKSDIEIKGDARKVAIQHFDQLGRVRLSRTLEDAATESGTDETQGIKVQTRYKYDNPTDPANSNGSYTLASNPYRAATSDQAASEEGMGWSVSYADKTGRNASAKTYAGAGLPAPFGSNTSLTGTVTTQIDANSSTVTDQAGKQRRSITNGLGQLTRVDEPDDAGNLGTIDAPTQATAYFYDTLGKMVKVTQGVQSRFFRYDSLGRLLRVRQPEQDTNAGLALADAITGNGDWSAGFTYDANGNLLTATDTKGTVITSAYDNLNRVTTRSYSDATPQVTYTYDDPNIQYAKGRLTKTSNAVSSSEILALDNLGRVTSSRQTTDGVNYDSAYSYNLAGMLMEETYPSGRKVKNTFQTDGDLARIETMQSGGAYATRADNFNYAAHGAIKHLQIGNGLWESAQFNNRLQVTQLGLGTSATDTSQWKLNYDFGTTDNNGNIKAQTVTSPVGTYAQSFTYDSLDRLKTAAETSGGNQTWTQSFTYDRYGNRTGFSQDIGGQVNNSTPTIDANTNRFNLGQGYTYDAAGNVITDPQGRSFTFNGDNKQTEVKDASNNIVGTYFYDGDGKRIKKVTNQETTTFVYSGGKLVAEYQLTEQTPTTATTQYLGTDMLGSPRVVSDQTGAVTSRRDFMPFGEELTRANYGTDSIRQKFTGYEKDTETGLDFAEARYYNSSIGRFTAVDPLLASGKSADPQTFNRYIYTMNNPLVMIDPTGMQAGTGENEVLFTQHISAFLQSLYDSLSQRTDYLLNGLTNFDPVDRANGQRFQNRIDAVKGDMDAADRIFQPVGNIPGMPSSDSVFEGINNTKEAMMTTYEITSFAQGVTSLGVGMVGSSGSSVTTNRGMSIKSRLSFIPIGIPTEEGLGEINSIRSSSSIGQGRNVAFARADFDSTVETISAASGRANRPGFAPVPQNRMFKTFSVGGFSREFDSENKLFEYFGRKATPSSTGTLDIFSENPVCSSCKFGGFQFQNRFPGIRLTINGGPPKY